MAALFSDGMRDPRGISRFPANYLGSATANRSLTLLRTTHSLKKPIPHTEQKDNLQVSLKLRPFHYEK